MTSNPQDPIHEVPVYQWHLMTRRLPKKAVQQGRSKRRGEEVQTALRVGRSPHI